MRSDSNRREEAPKSPRPALGPEEDGRCGDRIGRRANIRGGDRESGRTSCRCGWDRVRPGTISGRRRVAGRRPGFPSARPGSNRAYRTDLLLVDAADRGADRRGGQAFQGSGNSLRNPGRARACAKIPLDSPDTEWDLLLASSGTSAVTRTLPLPASGWRKARYSSLMPYSSNGTDTRWVQAAPVGPQPASTSLDALRQSLTDAPLRFRVDLVSATGSPVPAAHVELSQVREDQDDDQPTFDPVLHCPPALALRPAWLAGVRIGAYRGSRRGRGDPSP